ncbi:MAG: hybrid sensor histidine kinase/response regulator, partial [Akkermansiaceae bacterium]|nr:hybrid sensor histidine kinase/response regulator [Akkermansiaceae bacterium]
MLTIVDEHQIGYARGASDYLTKPVDWEKLAASLARYSASGKDLLLVEDDAETRELLRRSLIKHGWSVREADNGRSGLEAVAAQR